MGMSKHKTLLGLAAIFLAFLTLKHSGIEAFSWIPKANAAWDPGGEPLMSSIAYIVGILITGLNIGMWVLFQLLDIVLDPFFIFDLQPGGADGPLLIMLRNIWELVRDLMNVIFAILLIIGAVMTIIKSNTELVKNYRGKFVIAIILINFSWFIPRVILDVSQVLTYTVYQIPSLLSSGGVPNCRLPASADGTIPSKDCEIITNVWFLEDAENIVPTVGNQLPRRACPLQGLVCYSADSFNTQKTWNYNVIINGLIINHARLGVLANVTNPRQGGAQPPQGASGIRAMLTFLMRLLIVLVIHIGMFFPMLAMVVGFFIRIPILWITMAFMPVAFMGFVIGDKIPNFNPVEKIWKRFITAALLPAMVAVPLTVGFVMINAGANVPVPKGIAKLQTILPLFTGMKDIWQLLWMFIALFIMWIGTFAVLKQDELISKFTEPIKGYGEGIGKFAMKAPLAIPFIPGPGGKTVAPLELIKGASSSNLNAMLADGRLDKQDQGRFMGGQAAQQAAADAKKKIKNDITIQTNIKTMINTNDLGDAATPAARKAKLAEIFNKVKDLPEFQGMTQDTVFDHVLNDTTTGLTQAEVDRLKAAVQKNRTATP